MTLNKNHIRALVWLRDKPSHRAAWMCGEREAFGHPATWSHFRIAGREGQITIDTKTWDEISKYVATMPNDRQMYGLTPAGKGVLTKALAKAEAHA